MKIKLISATVFCGLFVTASLVNNANAGIITNGLGGSAGFGENSLAANDDGNTFVDLSTIFSSGLNFFGTNYTGLYVNNNGNVTFGSALSAFTPFALTGATANPIIAPFFADVDTRGGAVTATPGGNSTGSNLVYWDLDATGNGVFTATWDDVGFFDSNTSLLNAFQLQLIGVGGGDFDIKTTYESINWTTGDASGGTNGLGGTAARGGWNSGNGTDFEEYSWSGSEADILSLGSGNGSYTQVRNGAVSQTVPEPSTLAIFALGIIGLASRRFKKQS
jgi:hypothetical protein